MSPWEPDLRGAMSFPIIEITKNLIYMENMMGC